MNIEREMDTATMMSQVEILLPSIQKREWALRKQRNSSSRFTELLEFLLQEKNAIEYIESDIRDGNLKIRSGAHAIDVEEDPSSIHSLLKQNQVMMKQVAEGLVQVTEAVHSNRRYEADRYNRPISYQNDKRVTCWYHEIN